MVRPALVESADKLQGPQVVEAPAGERADDAVALRTEQATQYQDSGPPKGFGTPAGGKQKGWCALHLRQGAGESPQPVSYTHLRAHETVLDLVCRLLLEKQNKTKTKTNQ